MKDDYKKLKVNPLSVERFNGELKRYIKRENTGGKKVNQKIIAEQLGISEQQLNYLKNGSRRLTANMAEKFGELFQIYPRYLLGLSDQRRYTKVAFREETELLQKRDNFMGECLEYFGYEFLSYELNYSEEYREVIGVKYEIKTPNNTTIFVTDTRLNEITDEILTDIQRKLSNLQ